ncbi:MAG: cell wall hydrolase [Caulobacteraceae bacterium]|nr:cell wall hydrolase [Caulobacteraceae bacterium]
MDPAAIAALCVVLSRSPVAQLPPPGVVCPPSAATAPVLDGTQLAAQISQPGAREGIARVAFAEAGNQGDSGLAAVIYTILNRLADGRWGGSVDAVLNARSQFEPVMRVGGDWRALPPVSAADQARVDTILNLALEGRLPDLTHGARYFQNPAIVADRARRGTVSPSLVNFGGQTPTVVIGAHSFYAGRGRGGGAAIAPVVSLARGANESLFVGPNRADRASVASLDLTAAEAPGAPAVGASSDDPGRGLFVGRDGQLRADAR